MVLLNRGCLFFVPRAYSRVYVRSFFEKLGVVRYHFMSDTETRKLDISPVLSISLFQTNNLFTD